MKPKAHAVKKQVYYDGSIQFNSIQFNSIQFIQFISFNKIYKLIQPAYSKANRGGLYKLDISNKN